MKKLRLYGLIKSEARNVFIIEKKKIFLDNFVKFLEALNFDRISIVTELFKLMGSSDDNYSAKKYSNKLYEDEFFYFENKKYKVDLFFGKNKIILSIFTSSDDQKKITQLIMNFCKF